MSAGRRKKYVLIWWVDCKKSDVIELSLINKNHRKVNAITSLNWMDDDRAKPKKYEIKVLKIGSKYNL